MFPDDSALPVPDAEERREIERSTLAAQRLSLAVKKAAAARGRPSDSKWGMGYADGFRDALEAVEDAAVVMYRTDAHEVRRAGWLTDRVRYGSARF